MFRMKSLFSNRTNTYIQALLFILLLLSLHTTWARKPIFAVIPTTATQFTLPNNGNATVTYNVTNQTHITRMLTFEPIQGVTQDTSSGCTSPFVLAPNESCLLHLTINGSTMPPYIKGGPIICKTFDLYDHSPDLLLCAQPAVNNRLNITQGSAANANISLNPTAITLTVGETTPTGIQVTNNSPYVTANTITATVPAMYGVTENASNCLSLAPLATCTLTFVPGSVTANAINVPVSGTNTNTTTFQLTINKVTLSVTPLSLSFPFEETGTLIVTNTSSTTIAHNVTATLPAGTVSVASTTCTANLNPGANCSITFSATAPATVSATISGTNTYAISVPITAVGARISASPTSLVFDAGATGTVTITNDSAITAATGITAISPNPDLTFTNNCTAPLAPSGTCTIVFASAVPLSTTVTIAGSNTTVIHEPVTASVVNDIVTATPNPLTFTSSTTGTVTITNISHTVTVTTIAASIASGDPSISIANTTCTGSLAPLATCTVTFSSNADIDAAAIAEITGGNIVPFTFPVQAKQVTISASPSTITFIPNRTATVTITNQSPSGTASNIALQSKAPGGSPIVLATNGNTCPTSLPAGGTCTMTFTSPSSTTATTLSIAGTDTTTAIVTANVPSYAYLTANSTAYYCPIDLDTHLIGTCISAKSGFSASGIAVSTNNKTLYVLDTSGTIYWCSINADGTVTDGCPNSVASGYSSPNIITLSAAYIYIQNSNVVNPGAGGLNVQKCAIALNGSLSGCTTETNIENSNQNAVNNPTSSTFWSLGNTEDAIQNCPIANDGSIGTCNLITIPNTNGVQGNGFTLNADSTISYYVGPVSGDDSNVYVCTMNATGSAFVSCSAGTTLNVLGGGLQCQNPLGPAVDSSNSNAYFSCIAGFNSGPGPIIYCPTNAFDNCQQTAGDIVSSTGAIVVIS